MTNNSGKISLGNVLAYVEGNCRYFLYYSRFSWLIPKYIREQIAFRIKVMDKECYDRGSCKHCGCKTTALQMASKTCGGNCYPKMMSRSDWRDFKEGYTIRIDNRMWALSYNGSTKYKKEYREYSIDLIRDVEVKASFRIKTHLKDKAKWVF